MELNVGNMTSADVERYKSEIKTEKSILGYTVNKFGWGVSLNRYKYGHMKKCRDLRVDVDGNDVKFKRFSDEQIRAMRAGEIRDYQVISEDKDMVDYLSSKYLAKCEQVVPVAAVKKAEEEAKKAEEDRKKELLVKEAELNLKREEEAKKEGSKDTKKSK